MTYPHPSTVTTNISAREPRTRRGICRRVHGRRESTNQRQSVERAGNSSLEEFVNGPLPPARAAVRHRELERHEPTHTLQAASVITVSRHERLHGQQAKSSVRTRSRTSRASIRTAAQHHATYEIHEPKRTVCCKATPRCVLRQSQSFLAALLRRLQADVLHSLCHRCPYLSEGSLYSRSSRRSRKSPKHISRRAISKANLARRPPALAGEAFHVE